jgi:hypothetical protein
MPATIPGFALVLRGHLGLQRQIFVVGVEGHESHRRPRVLHLEGLCGPETAKRSRLSLVETLGHRPGSRLRFGSKTDAKQVDSGFCVFCAG